MQRTELRLELGVAACRQFENGQCFFRRLDLSLPAVDRVNLRNHVSARGQPRLDQVAGDSPGDLRVGKGTEGENDLFGHPQAGCNASARQIHPPPTTMSPS